MESFDDLDSSTRPLMQYRWSYGRIGPLRNVNLTTCDGHLHQIYVRQGMCYNVEKQHLM